MAGPDSSYSCLEIHICWKVDNEARMEPPIQTEYLEIFDASQDLCLIIFVLSYSLSLWWSNGLDLHGGGGEGGDLLLHPVGDAGEHGGATRQHDVGIEILTGV